MRVHVNINGNNHPPLIIDIDIERVFNLIEEQWEELPIDIQEKIIRAYIYEQLIIGH